MLPAAHDTSTILIDRKLEAAQSAETIPARLDFREEETSNLKSAIPVSEFENYVFLKKADPENAFDDYKVGNLILDSDVAPVTADMQL